MVQSARVQKVVQGDDVILKHQIMEDIAYNAEKSRAPVLVNAQDIANFFYPLAALMSGNPPVATPQIDPIGFIGQPVGAYPTSTFTVPIPGTIVVPNVSNRGTSTFEIGRGRTVRAEILRFQATFVGNLVLNNNVLSGLASVTGLAIGQQILGAGIAPVAQGVAPTLIESIDPIGLTVTLTSPAISAQTGATFKFYTKETHYSIDEVDVWARGFPGERVDNDDIDLGQ